MTYLAASDPAEKPFNTSAVDLRLGSETSPPNEPPRSVRFSKEASPAFSLPTQPAGVWHDQGFTAILVTHDVAEAVALADRVLVIEDGRIAEDFSVDVPRPRRRGSAELAALEGAILKNLLEGTEDSSDL